MCVPLASGTHTQKPVPYELSIPDALPVSPSPLPNVNCFGLKNVISVGGAFNVLLFNDRLVRPVFLRLPPPPVFLQ